MSEKGENGIGRMSKFQSVIVWIVAGAVGFSGSWAVRAKTISDLEKQMDGLPQRVAVLEDALGRIESTNTREHGEIKSLLNTVIGLNKKQ